MDAVKTITNADMVLFVVDGQEGVTPLDVKIAKRLRELSQQASRGCNLGLVVNKLDQEGSDEYYEALSRCVSDCYSLELGEPVFVSARDRAGIHAIRELICKTLSISCTNKIRHIEELALVGELLPNVYRGYHVPEDENKRALEEAEVDKSMRVCSSVRGSFKPSDRWVRLLNNICDSAPFAVAEEEKYIIPSALSPGENLARMYIPKDHSDAMPVMDKEEDEVDTVTAKETDETPDCAATKDVPKLVRPLRIVLLGSVESCHNRLAMLLSDCNIDAASLNQDFLSETLSPNWHQFYGEWTLPSASAPLPQPVELYSAAALNLGGSLGRVASVQTVNLIRKADFIIMCCKNTDERHPWKVALSKKETSWMARVIRIHKPLAVVVPVSQPPKQKLVLDLNHSGYEFSSVPIFPVRIHEDASDESGGYASPEMQRRAVRRLKKEVVALINSADKVIETSKLNKWLRMFLSKWPPPWHEGAKVNVKFAAQVRGSPPTFVMWSNVYGGFPQHYIRQMKRAISEEFGFQGVPLKFILRTTAEPKSTSRRTNLSWKRKLHNV
ncbi:ribosome biogenesis GTPase Der protein [Babesia caballi]|uniref:Ribosome biogenesis GTPase Der protein n=1 Tax=Babesia caballi TaxID=5871 RepID=A0AAV4M286_BABCB|nr:ribosome biogenesis GTPase Der protein [Babesia caballi]